MIDLTGAPFECIPLNSCNSTNNEMRDLWYKLIEYDRNGYLISSSTDGFDNSSEEFVRTVPVDDVDVSGLVKGHAYTLLTVKQSSIHKNIKLIKLRNPWGEFEWKGKWCDSSTCWTEELLSEFEVTLDEDDGTFWMSYEDFLRNFICVNVVMIRHDLNNIYHEHRKRAWFQHNDNQLLNSTNSNIQRSGVLIQSTIYVLTVLEDYTDVYLSLHQDIDYLEQTNVYQNSNSSNNSLREVDIGIALLHVHEGDGSLEVIMTSSLVIDRQVQIYAKLLVGIYLVVPLSTGCNFDVYMNNNSDSYSTDYPLIDEGGKNFTDKAIAAFDEIFTRLDSDLDGVKLYTTTIV
jgi:hypothetical protein